MIESDKTRAKLASEIIKNGLITIMIEGRSKEFQVFIQTLAAKDIESIRLYNPEGSVIASSINSETGKNIDDIAGNLGIPRPEASDIIKDGNKIYDLNVPIYNEGLCRKCHENEPDVMAFLNVSFSLKGTYDDINRLRDQTIAFYLIILFVFSVTLWLITVYLVDKPIMKILGTMKRVEEGEFFARYEHKGSDEIGRLGGGLNSMLSRLEKIRMELETCHMESIQKVEKMATIGELAAVIAHEIKNPLAGISGAIQVFAEDLEDADPRKEIIGEVQKEIERLDKSVRDLLNFARPPEPHFVNVPLGSVIERSAALISGQAKKMEIDVNILSPGETVEVSVDPEQMQQVLLNIMLNAIHSMPGGGSLNIATSLRREEKAVEVSITDTGQGIGEEKIKDIFKPFFSTKGVGTGLGLAISKNIIDKHKGEIVVQSRLGIGSTFRIRLPLKVKNG